MVTIYDIADATGLSISTVSRALRDLPGASPKTRALVRASAERLRYQPLPAATALAGGRLRAIGVVTLSLAVPGCAEALEAVSVELRRASYDLLLIDSAVRAPNQGQEFSIAGLGRKVDGILGIGVEFTPAEIAAFRGKPGATILLSAGAHGGMVQAAATRATRHLLELL